MTESLNELAAEGWEVGTGTNDDADGGVLPLRGRTQDIEGMHLVESRCRDDDPDRDAIPVTLLVTSRPGSGPGCPSGELRTPLASRC